MVVGAPGQAHRGSTTTTTTTTTTTGVITETVANTNTTNTSAALKSWWHPLQPWPSASAPSPPWSSAASVGDTSSSSSGSSSSSSSSSRRKLPFVVVGNLALALAACAWLANRIGVDGQPDKYMTAGMWKDFLSQGGKGDATWFAKWNAMAQPRIDELASLVEAEANAAAEGTEDGGAAVSSNGNQGGPFRVTMVGDSTMMQQHGVICAFLGERADRRFNPAEHQEECCIDTLPRHRRLQGQPGGTPETSTTTTTTTNSPGNNNNNNNNSGTISDESNRGGPGFTVGGTAESAEEDGGGRGLCFRHAFQRFAEPLEWESELGSPDAVYFGTGLHFLHMARPGHGLEQPRVQGWLTYEKDLENAVETYRAEGGDGFRLVFMTSHTIQDSVYEGEFKEVLEGYRNNDAALISTCKDQIQWAAGGTNGPKGYDPNSYCRQALLDRNGSEVLNRRSRPVMERLGVPLVESDLIVKDQEWATPRMDGRHYHMLVPVEVWDLLGVLVSPFDNGAVLESAR